MPIGPLESLVIEAGRQYRREPTVYRTNIKANTRPTIDALGAQPCVNFHGACPRIRSAPRTQPDVHQAGGFLDTAGIDAARAMQFEAAADQLYAVRQQRRGKRITLKS